MTIVELQEKLWNHFLAHPEQWCDNRRKKRTPQHPDFYHKDSKSGLWLRSRKKPAWVDLQIAKLDVGVKGTSEWKSTPAQNNCELAKLDSHVDLRTCKKLCQNGPISDAVDALDLLVQRGSLTSNNLFFHVLKRCINDKELALGRRVHALTVRSGYDGDAFLATHLIQLYALHGSLVEAMQVFAKVATPDAYNWASIIFAYAKHGEATDAAEAIRLYQIMCESTAVKPDDRIYLAVLQACATARDLLAGKEVHAHILARPREPDIFVQAALINMYVKCGSLEDARRLFDKIPEKNVVTWTAMIAGCAKQGLGQEALTLYRSMQEEGLTPPNSVTFIYLLQACASLGQRALQEGKKMHAIIREQGLLGNEILLVSLVHMYAKCGSLGDARKLFEVLSVKDVVTWTLLITEYVHLGMGQEALCIYRSMEAEGVSTPNSVTYVCLLQACASVGVSALVQGKRLHSQIKERGLQVDVILGGSLVNMYAKCGSLEDARRVFDELSERNVVACNAMLSGYVNQGLGLKALDLYTTEQLTSLSTPSSATFVCLLKACGHVGVAALDQGKQLHAEIRDRGLQEDVVLGGSLVNMYAKCGCLDDARSVFNNLPTKNVVAYNAMLAGYAQQGMGREALNLYNSMDAGGLAPSSATFVCLLQACANLGVSALSAGKQLHAQIRERGLEEDVVLGGSLVNMHAKCGSLEDARKMFDRLPERNVVAWNAMISGYVQHGMGQEALTLNNIMQQEGTTPPDCVTYACLLQACSSLGEGALSVGKELHVQIEEQGLLNDVILGGCLVNMYAKCGSLEAAGRVFDKLQDRSVVAWNSIIAGYAQQGMGHEAYTLYSKMQLEGLTPANSVTYVILLQACAVEACLSLGQQLHAEIAEHGLQADGIVGTALIYMYAKCGSMSDSRQVFESLQERTVQAWGALLDGYARQGNSQVVFEMLERMRLEGVHPNEVLFGSLLTVCSHAGLVERGREYFELMSTQYGIRASVEHLVCMVDLLGRAGHLEEALEMAKRTPLLSNIVVWHTLLSACQKWKDVEFGLQAFNCAISVDEKDAASYVLMANIYASAEMWEAATEMQAKRTRLGAWKKPGHSRWTDMDGVVHTIFAGYKKLPGRGGTVAMLTSSTKEEYIPVLACRDRQFSDVELHSCQLLVKT